MRPSLLHLGRCPRHREAMKETIERNIIAVARTAELLTDGVKVACGYLEYLKILSHDIFRG